MKIRTPFCYIEVEYLFLIFSFICIFSSKMRIYFTSFFMCYIFIIFHELSHVFVASILGKKIDNLKFTLSGMNVKFEREKYKLKNNDTYFNNILIYIAGPLSNIILALIFCKIRFILEINLTLAIINLFPIYPLDGYNILKNVFGNNIKRDIYLKFIEKFILSILMIISIYQLVFLKNISMLIFCIYILFIKRSKNWLKLAKNT